MRASLALLIVLAVGFIFVGTSAAAPGGEVKASPLFKRSLEESIAKLEGQAPEATAQTEAEPIPTGKPRCPKPNELPTEAGDTCYDSCNGTCSATCGGPVTCGGSTCGGSTCSSTCANTCVGGPCANYRFYGVNWWYYYGNGWNEYYGQLPHGYFIDSDENKFKWNDESNWRSFDYWNINNGSYDKTITRTTTSAGYTVRGEVALWQFGYYDPPFNSYGNQVSQGSTQAQNQNDLSIPIGF